ncbi:MAG: protein-glutamate O-methyltransferase [Alphaproteobacteria bacterium]|nr:protein-glutamate O-methyltransferase [Alphaproteobacteria bacterium]
MSSPRATPSQDRAQVLDTAGFARVSLIAEREAGLTIPTAKQAMVQSRLSRRLAATGMTDFASYLSYVEGRDGVEERANMISALTTNVSSFFRENHHFETLREKILPGLAERARAGGRVRLWSAGCSSGQEPYSIAMCVLEVIRDAARLDVRILATDIDRAILAQAKTGTYDERQMSGVPKDLRDKHFNEASAKGHASWTANDGLRSIVTFRQLNLIEPWPMSAQFDVVFCRNVVIYFSEETQMTLWPRFAKVMPKDAWFFLGHSERIQSIAAPLFETRGVTSYQRSSASAERLSQPERT